MGKGNRLCAADSVSATATAVQVSSFLGDPGAVSGGGKKSKRARKNLGEEKSRTRMSFKLSGLCHVIVF